MPLKPIDLQAPQPLRCFIYGDNGVGKTHLLGTLKGSLAVIDYHGNVEVLKKSPNAPNISVFEGPTSWNDIMQMFTDPILDNFTHLALDNFTGLNRILVNTAMSIPLKGEGTRPSPEIPIMRDYGLAAERLRYVVNLMYQRSLARGQNIYGISHIKLDKDAETESLVGGPSLPGQTPSYFVSMFTEFLYLTIQGDGKRVVYVKKHIYYPAATRRLIDDKPIIDPNLDRMYFSGGK